MVLGFRGFVLGFRGFVLGIELFCLGFGFFFLRFRIGVCLKVFLGLVCRLGFWIGVFDGSGTSVFSW